jgi:glutaredoxin
MTTGPRLVLYSRAYCHLCHDMQRALEGLKDELGFELEVLDVDADPALEERFGEIVPVLAHGDVELARVRLDASEIRAYVARFR